jgi:zinc/manganese transport system substrate-binding protein
VAAGLPRSPHRARRLIASATIVLAALAVVLGACKPSMRSPASGPLNVVAGENTWGDIAAQIGGDRAKVTSIVSAPGVDPHLYEPTAADAVAVANARVAILNGLGYDDFMRRLIAGSGAHPQVVSAAGALGVSASGADPHLWYDLPAVASVATAIGRALVAVDPAGAPAYAANLARFQKSLAPAVAVVSEIKEKHAQAPVAYTERVAGYLLREAGLKLASPLGFATAVENGTDPSPADAQAMQTLIASKKVRLLIYNVQTVSAVTERMRRLAVRAGVPVVGVSETMPARFRTYQAWQLDQAKQILDALGG